MRVLTVVSKNGSEVSAFQWDLDSVIEDKKWDCIELESDELSSIPCVDRLIEIEMGTLVVWQNFDIAFKKNSGKVREYLSYEMSEAEKYLRLVFHRFLSNKFKPFRIYVNNDPLEPFDPFLEDHPKTDTKKASEITIENETIRVQPFILPHMSDLSDNDANNIIILCPNHHRLLHKLKPSFDRENNRFCTHEFFLNINLDYHLR